MSFLLILCGAIAARPPIGRFFAARHSPRLPRGRSDTDRYRGDPPVPARPRVRRFVSRVAGAAPGWRWRCTVLPHLLARSFRPDDGRPTRAASAAVLERYEPVSASRSTAVRTVSKMFCGCSTEYDARQRTAGLPGLLRPPGALPVIIAGPSSMCLPRDSRSSQDPRRGPAGPQELLLPDLPKGYQISTYDLPLRSAGRLPFDTTRGRSPWGSHGPISRDTAKLLTRQRSTAANQPRRFQPFRCALMEIVTDPDVRGRAGPRYAEELQLLLRAIGASDADMERGHSGWRRTCPPGAARRRTGPGSRSRHELVPVVRAGYRTEIERRRRPSTPASRSSRRHAAGTKHGTTYVMRIKESSDDYRYSPSRISRRSTSTPRGSTRSARHFELPRPPDALNATRWA